MTLDRSIEMSDERVLLIRGEQYDPSREIHCEDEEDVEDADKPIKGTGYHNHRRSFWSKMFANSLPGKHRPQGYSSNSNQDKFSRYPSDWLFQHASRNSAESYYNIISPSQNEARHNSSQHEHDGSPERKRSSSGIGKDFVKCCCGPTLVCCLTLLVVISTLLFLIKLSVLVIYQKESIQEAELYLNKTTEIIRMRSSNWIVANPKCHIPKLDPWHKSIKKYVTREKPMNCALVAKEFNLLKTLTFIKNNKLEFSEDAIKLNAISNCCYRAISRSNENDQDLEYEEKCNNVTTLNDDSVKVQLIKVECKSLNYTNYHSFVLHDVEEENALKRVAEVKLKKDDHYNILMVGVDTISRLNGYRQLNETLDYLRSAYNTLEFPGYNKVGENTFPNLIPLLTGLRPDQLIKVMCWQTNYTDESEAGHDYLDNCKYLWNYYQQVGYLTYFSEDWPQASTFNYLKPGFRNRPTVYYGRPLTLARDDLLVPPVKMGCKFCLRDRPIVEVDLENLRNFIDESNQQPFFAFHWINCPQHDDLNGASSVDSILRQFFADIKKQTADDRTFVFFFSDHGYRWNDFVSTRIGHYESSLPMLNIAVPRLFIDNHPDLYANLKLHQSALLTPFDMFKTVIGLRNLGLRPEHAKRQTKRRAAMQSTTLSPVRGELNSTTMSPTATTTIGLLRQLDGLSYKQEFETFSILDKHSSEQLDRSCIEAGIPDNYCICNQFQSISTKSLDVIGAAYYLVYVHMDEQIRERVDICHLLELSKIVTAEFFDFRKTKKKIASSTRSERGTTSDKEKISSNATQEPQSTALEQEMETNKHTYLPNREYNILLTTKPGDGLFQEVVRFYGNDMDACKKEVEHAIEIVTSSDKSLEQKYSSVIQMNKICQFSVHSSSISRLNLYKDQSKCVKSGIELKKICYCNNLLAPGN